MKRLFACLWIPLFLIGLVSFPDGVHAASQSSDDICMAVLVPRIEQSGLDPTKSAPIFGCQLDGGQWHVRTLLDIRDGNYKGSLDARGQQLLSMVDVMSMDQAFRGVVWFDRNSSKLYTLGPGGKVDESDLSSQSVGSAPNWLNNYLRSYTSAMETYLTRTADEAPELVQYMQWLMARRDATLQSMANGLDPMSQSSFKSVWGFQQFPWFWQLGDPVAIAAYTGQGLLVGSPDDEVPSAVQFPTPTQISRAASPDGETPTIQVTKRRCDGRDIFPVFAESHCVDVPDASFTLKDPGNIHAETLSSGKKYAPDLSYYVGSNLWNLEDTSSNASMRGVRVVSCLASKPGSTWHSSTLNVVHPAEHGTVLLDWTIASTGIPNQAYRPSLDCIWFELPDIDEPPAILSLQVFTADTPYLNWTEIPGPRLPDLGRGESGEDLEAEMVMTNVETGDIYSFAADAYGQVLVPAGTYSLVETASDLESYFSMGIQQTTLVEVGLAASANAQTKSVAPVETQTFFTGALYCDAGECSPITGVKIFYASMDGFIQGQCVTEAVQTPNGTGAWCNYEYISGMPTVLTLDESTLPSGTALTTENPQTYLVPEHPDGELSPVYFRVGPAQNT